MAESLGKAVLDLEANVGPFTRNMEQAHASADRVESALDAVAAIAKISTEALSRVKMTAGQASESRSSASGILSGVRGISDESRMAARELDKVKLSRLQAAETNAAGDVIDRKLNAISRNADQARRALDRVKLSGGVPGRSGVGVGPFGSGFGRVGVLGAGLGLGALTAPAAIPALGALAALPAFGAGTLGVVGTLALALDNVGKAIGGDKKAFDSLTPSAQRFAQTIRSLEPALQRLKQTAGTSLFPGLTQGLKSALSPGTLAAITTAVQQFGKAIGAAGAQWGGYFGSAEFQSIFGPLMQAGARSFAVFSDAALHLFDALGVLGRAAIPLTSWMTQATDNGAKLADNWLHAKDASGGLSRAMSEAQASLRLVGGAIVALGRVFGALGTALYPVSKIAVKDLTDGLNALAGIIRRNQAGIREFVQGALSALVATVKTAAPIVGNLARWLGAVVRAVGGWRTAFEIVIGGYLATKFVTLGTSIAAVATNVTKLRLGMLALGGPEVLAALAAVAIAYHEITSPKSLLHRATDDSVANAPGLPIYKSGKWVNADSGKPVTDQAYWNRQYRVNHPKGTTPLAGSTAYGATGPYGGADFKSANLKPAAASTTSTSVFGTPPPFTKNLPATPSPAALPLELPLRLQLQQAKADASGIESKEKTVALAIKRWAQVMLRSHKLTTLQTIDAYNLIASENSALAALVAASAKALKKVLPAPELVSEHGLVGKLAKIPALSTSALKANEMLFLASFQHIEGAYMPNAAPAAPSSKQTDTHLYSIKHELREHGQTLKRIAGRSSFPASGYSVASAQAAALG